MKKRNFLCQTDLYPSGKELLEKASVPLQYDIVFLDISMAELDGLETARKLRQLSEDVYIVFVTAYITYAIEGYTVDAVRYLLKDNDSIEDALKECLDTIIKRMRNDKITYDFNFLNGQRTVPLDSILYVESRLHKVIFFIMEDTIKEFFMYDKLDAVELKLQQYGFCRVHQSFLVNMKYVTNIKRYIVSLNNGSEISVSKKYYKDVETEFIRQQGEL